VGPLGPILGAILMVVGVPVVVFGVLKAIGYDWDKPWLMWRTKADPLPLWVYVGVCAFLARVCRQPSRKGRRLTRSL
jgi:hypothetical protein